MSTVTAMPAAGAGGFGRARASIPKLSIQAGQKSADERMAAAEVLIQFRSTPRGVFISPPAEQSATVGSSPYYPAPTKIYPKTPQPRVSTALPRAYPHPHPPPAPHFSAHFVFCFAMPKQPHLSNVSALRVFRSKITTGQPHTGQSSGYTDGFHTPQFQIVQCDSRGMYTSSPTFKFPTVPGNVSPPYSTSPPYSMSQYTMRNQPGFDSMSSSGDSDQEMSGSVDERQQQRWGHMYSPPVSTT